LATDYSKIRDILIQEIEADVVGPREPYEQLKISPTGKYLSGVLYPKNISLQSTNTTKESPDSNFKRSSEGEEQDTITDASNFKMAMPNSIGITCNVSIESKSVKLIISYGRYKKGITKGKERGPWKREPFPTSEVDAGLVLDMVEGKHGPFNIGDMASYEYNIKKSKSGKYFILTVFLRNKLETNESKPNPSRCVFQPIIRLESINSSENCFIDVTSKISDDEDPDQQLFALLFKHRKQFAIGHGCSATWNLDKIIGDSTNMVETTFIPKFEIPKVGASNSPKIKMLKGLDLVELSKDELLHDCKKYKELLDPIVTEYSLWINEMKESVKHLEGFSDVGNSQILEFTEALERIQKGIDIISTKQEAGEAFWFTNKVMLYQRSYSEWAKINIDTGKRNGKEPQEMKGKWRLFQIAFILLNIESIYDPNSTYRKCADLLWFPTGGGKTEAYLGLIAFTLALKRLKKKGYYKYGVIVMMRYTLRLLTIQQFQRAASLMCACERIRLTMKLPDGKLKWGSERFRVGLWVGRKTTPNDLDDPVNGARVKHRELLNGKPVKESNPYIFRVCPWCGSSLTPREIDFDEKIKHMQVFCSDDTCHFSKKFHPDGLPVLLVDSDIYKLCPSMIIATVDKYAQIAKKPETGALFGKVMAFSENKGFIRTNDFDPPKTKIEYFSKFGQSELDPPELIIQDELHLISGPLGTLTGLYETAIDILCTRNGIPPKIIASTATTRKAQEQIKSLFNREKIKLFPPQGFKFGDSFFSEEITIDENNDEKRGRLYLGLCPTSRTGLTLLARVSATILYTIRKLLNDGADPKILDPFFTIVSYFNSMKELSQANRVYDDSVPDMMYNISNNYDMVEDDESEESEEDADDESEESTEPKAEYNTPRRIVKDELTSRKDHSEIPQVLEDLSTSNFDKERIPLDVLLCTNMIQVGVDIDRLGIMIINGQPKNTSEYIQASGRIGRQFPGLIITTFNHLKPRDLSHYENFLYYHSTFHKNVEPVSLTPFSPRSRDRGLFGVLVALTRLQEPLLAPRNSAGRFRKTFPQFEDLIHDISKKIEDRVENVDKPEAADTKKHIESHYSHWDKYATEEKDWLRYERNPYLEAVEKDQNNRNYHYLMRSKSYTIDKNEMYVPNSLREAEDEVNLRYYTKNYEDESDE